MNLCHTVLINCASVKYDFNTIKPIRPTNKVINIWLKLAISVMAIIFNLLPSGIYIIRPKYSPTLFGVVTEKETPDNTALKDCMKLIGCITATAIFHLTASRPQFNNMSKQAPAK